MEKIEETTKTEVWCSEDQVNRYLFKKTWGKADKQILLITINPVSCVPYVQDMTTMLIEEQVRKLGFNGFNVLNLFSKVTKGNTSRAVQGLMIEEEQLFYKNVMTDKAIKKYVVGVGSIIKKNQSAKKQLEKIHELFTPKQQKLLEVLVDMEGQPSHPLSPKMRYEWNFQSFDKVFDYDKSNVNVHDKKHEKITER